MQGIPSIDPFLKRLAQLDEKMAAPDFYNDQRISRTTNCPINSPAGYMESHESLRCPPSLRQIAAENGYIFYLGYYSVFGGVCQYMLHSGSEIPLSHMESPLSAAGRPCPFFPALRPNPRRIGNPVPRSDQVAFGRKMR